MGSGSSLLFNPVALGEKGFTRITGACLAGRQGFSLIYIVTPSPLSEAYREGSLFPAGRKKGIPPLPRQTRSVGMTICVIRVNQLKISENHLYVKTNYYKENFSGTWFVLRFSVAGGFVFSRQ